ncbi:MAG TPA: nucleotide exchange factor GrpE [Candidatus Merdenecus merdavium]|nr:nucleotide exchange factor GrpE [Candidatus Merdenecus merdavium]
MAEHKDLKEELKDLEEQTESVESDKEEINEVDEVVDEADEAESATQETKKGIFGKKKDKKDPKDLQIEDLTDRLKRQMAEFDNYRKRTDKEKSAMYEIGAKDIVSKILPIVDNFERGLGGVEEEQKSDPFVEGMDMIYRQLLSTLEELDVKPIEAVGQPFDPNLHNAVMHVEDEEFGESTVVEEFLKGYTYRSSVVRNSMVKVAN